jgi:hypothetical protein
MVPEFVNADAYEYIEMRDFLDLPPLPEVTDEPIRSDLPVLMLNGSFDPITPDLANDVVRQLLPNSFEIESPSGGHVQFIAGGACAQEIVAAFVADPATEPDSSCVAESEPCSLPCPLKAADDGLNRRHLVCIRCRQLNSAVGPHKRGRNFCKIKPFDNM